MMIMILTPPMNQKKEEEDNMYLMANHKYNEVNDLIFQFIYYKLFLICKKLNNELRNFKKKLFLSLNQLYPFLKKKIKNC